MAYLAYHSALTHHGTVENALPLKRYERNESIAFQHDIMSGPGGSFPVEFAHCDVFYLDPPWRVGFKVFNDRVENTPSKSYTFNEFRKRIGDLVATVRVPVILVWGKGDGAHLPTPSYTIPIVLIPSGAAFAYCYNFDRGLMDTVFETTGQRKLTSEDIIKNLAGIFNHVGDAVCGYGNTGRIFHQAGKSFTVSDMNPGCIGYIANHIEGLAR